SDCGELPPLRRGETRGHRGISSVRTPTHGVVRTTLKESHSYRRRFFGRIRASSTSRMPSAAVILGDLTAIANEWRTLAIFWHVFTGTLLIAIATRQNVSNR